MNEYIIIQIPNLKIGNKTGGKQMKKVFALILAVMMVLALFTGCGETKTPAETETPAGTEAPTPAETDSAEQEGGLPEEYPGYPATQCSHPHQPGHCRPGYEGRLSSHGSDHHSYHRSWYCSCGPCDDAVPHAALICKKESCLKR